MTHEQADFDAIASLLGAYLLFSKSQPVIPSRLNRNVRAFINLYASELPFVSFGELASQPIDQITLVDTQSLASTKGISKSLPVHVIDHHEKKAGFPKAWSLDFKQNGANTTNLVEKIKDAGIALSPVHSTLLLLGIYEDTGSFSYKSTTTEDLLMAGRLIHHGADIQAVNRYLNPPLSSEQQELLNKLLEKANSYSIHGQRIVITHSDAVDLTDEISSIAHKIRDYLDPDGLFLIVKTQEGIRLVGRSTSNQIDVSKILKSFGGGGHERAAAALINTKTSDPELFMRDLELRILKDLENSIHTPVPIKKIMSLDPKMLVPTAKVSEALKLMVRYGYEGFPVIDHGKVIGLLSRKAVDRAINHKIELPVKSLMEAGSFSVYETDDISILQTVMSESGWGQIPVLDPQSGRVTGIVTRTDLLRILLKNNKSSHQPSSKVLLEKRLDPIQLGLIDLVTKEATRHEIPIYIVGGFVRDLLLNRSVYDFDMVIEGDAVSFARTLAFKFGGKITNHIRFGTARWDLDASIKLPSNFRKKEGGWLMNRLPHSLDFITARSEYYTHPTALPKVEKGSLKLDMQRRDFTINTLAIRLDGEHFGELIDYFNGFEDLTKQEIRILHPLSFVDDPTRILRAYRFASRFKFIIEKRTKGLIFEANYLLRSVSGARIKHEFNLIFEESDPCSILENLSDQGILESIHPDFIWNEGIKQYLEILFKKIDQTAWQLPKTISDMSQKAYISYLLWLSSLALEKSTKVANRLRLPSVVSKLIGPIVKIESELDRFLNLPPSGISKRLDNLAPIALYVLYLKSNSLSIQDLMIEYLEKWSKVVISVNGHDLINMGVKRGPEIKRILENVRFQKIDGKFKNEEEERKYIKTLVQKYIA